MAEHIWFFTAPEDPVLKRRGDPLGFRQATDTYAELLAPGLSNRTVDGRWLTILCWVLRNANDLWQHFRSGGDTSCPGDSRQAAAGLYAWIRPLELLWIARAKALLGERKPTGYQLPGIRAVERWYNNDTDLDHFGLSRDQLRRYRQTGLYGAYRVALRRLKGLTLHGDGWTVGEEGRKLASIVDTSLSWKSLNLAKRDSRKGRKPDEEIYCRRQVWSCWKRAGKEQFLPESARHVRRLPEAERTILRRALFGAEAPEADEDANRRLKVIRIIKATKEKDHAAVCGAIARGLRKELGDSIIGLQEFSVLADAGVRAMNGIWEAMRSEESVSVQTCAHNASVQSELAKLKKAAERWRRLKNTGSVTGLDTANCLADTICRACPSAPEILRALIAHHVEHGGGMRWFRLSPDERTILRVARDRRYGGALYRFRLVALSRMAVQCEVLAASRYKRLFGGELDELDED